MRKISYWSLVAAAVVETINGYVIYKQKIKSRKGMQIFDRKGQYKLQGNERSFNSYIAHFPFNLILYFQKTTFTLQIKK